MESLSSELALKLKSFNIQKLQQIMQLCNLPRTKSKKNNYIYSLTLFLLDPKNHIDILKKFPKDLHRELMEFLPDPSLSCICEKTEIIPTITCSVCTKKQHRECIGSLIFLLKYICISCQMRQLNPIDEIVEYLLPPSLISNKSTAKSFTVSQSLLMEIANANTESKVQVRCVKIENPGFAISWPKQGELKINGKTVKRFKELEIPRYKRKDMALDISMQLESGENEISLEIADEISNYCLAVAKIKSYTEDEMKNRLSANIVTKEESLRIVRSKFLSESDVKLTSVRITLSCPYTLKLINIPTRGKDCRHLDCFDLERFIIAQKYEHFSWKCPICKGPAYSIFVDKFFEEILNRVRGLEDIESVQIFENGSYEPVLKRNEKNNHCNKQKYNSEVIFGKKLKVEEKCEVIDEGMSEVIEID